MAQKPGQEKEEGNNEKITTVDEEDDMEEMDGKAKALTNLLKTSSVSSALALQTCHDR